MPPTQADMDFGLYMYTHQMLPEQIAEQTELIEEHEEYIQTCDREIQGLKDSLKEAASGDEKVSEHQAQEWIDRIATLESEKEYEVVVREAQKEKSDLEVQRRQAIEEYDL